MLELFLQAMGGEWIVERYSVDEDTGKLRVHYVSKLNPMLEWAHNPHGELSKMPMIGQVGYIGFLAKETAESLGIAPDRNPTG